MSVYKEIIEVRSKGASPTFINVTEEVRGAIEKSGIRDGIATVISPHTTCGVFFEEFVHDVDADGVETLQHDLNDVLKKIIPDQMALDDYHYPAEEHYRAVERWPNAAEYLPDGDRSALFNGDAHLKATLIGSSQTFLVDGGKLGVGTTGYIYFVDFDRTRARTRKCQIVVLGA
ncbi:YjbQ family protein [Selenomonas sp. TAMA-11512]|uniref:YjbQ family protein n=1 Tax=Selenomonas sp. TAMA-11512 TaxID=3095337 RepID=UPI003091FD4A|nr:YjbQ family protein [Selenomonas sp. TAMA-11512]